MRLINPYSSLLDPEDDAVERMVIAASMREHGEVLDFFRGLPAVLRKHILTFHKSRRPIYSCVFCQYNLFPEHWVMLCPAVCCCCLEGSFRT